MASRLRKHISGVALVFQSSWSTCMTATVCLIVGLVGATNLRAQANDAGNVVNVIAESGNLAEQEAIAAVTPPDAIELTSDEAAPVDGFGIEGSVTGRKDARTMSLAIPAPRGQITDRHGEPFAQTKVVYYPALKYGQFEKADRDYVIEWGRKRVEQANEIFGIDWQVTDEALWQHYRHRRWLAMAVSHVVDEERKKGYEGQLMNGLVLHPVYLRYYPHGKSASHIIGYTGSTGKLEKGPINYGDPIFKRAEGRSGFEKIFNKELSGKDGLLREDYDVDGSLVYKKYEKRPVPGGNVVTTLDLAWQNQAEAVLEKYCERGAFVVIDIHTGEVVAMASRPCFDLNDFIPFISNEKYKELREDPGKPLFGRAFQGAYPPASTFKPVVAVTALSNGEVHEFSLIDCPEKIKIGKHWFHNWSKEPEGFIDVKRAIARSCNPWFYKVGIQTGPTAFLSVARRLGFGSKTGLPLIGETEGLVPTNEWMVKNHNRRMMDGDTANLSIGQGVMLASPLQVAQGMAGLANGGALPKLHLIKQVQSVNGRVLVSQDPERRNFLNLDPNAVGVVHEGMMQVVNAGYGTGQRARLSYAVLCGKTGTAQWGPESEERRLAWFAGFFPLDNPRYAFAALYEGKPGEKLSGGRKAAPMVSSFFEHFKKDIKKSITPPPRAMVIEDEEGFEVRSLDDGSAPRAIPLDEDEDGGIVPAGEDPRPLRAIPVEDDEAFFIDEVPLNTNGQRPLRAVPVEEE